MQQDLATMWGGHPNVSCIPAARIIPSGACEMCHWDPLDQVFSATVMFAKYRSKRNAVLDAIDCHVPITTVPHIAVLGDLHDVYYVCRHCFFLLRQKGQQHYRNHGRVGELQSHTHNSRAN